MAQERKNGGQNVTIDNYSATVKDAAGALILPPVKSYGARGLENKKWGYDSTGVIVENGWSKKIDLYRIINDTAAKVSARVEAIDTRVITLISDSKTYMAAYAAYADAQREIDELYAMIPGVFSLGFGALKGSYDPTSAFSVLPGVSSTAVKLLSKTEKPDDYKILMYQLQKKLIRLETELGALQVLKSNLTGEYAKFDKLFEEERSANISDSWLFVGIAAILLFILYRLKKR